MSEILENIGIGRNSAVIVAALMVWMVVVACAVSSVLKQPFTRQQRIAWLAIIIGVPLFGLMAYLPFSIQKGDHPLLFQVKQ